MDNKVITITGPDRSGKETQIALLGALMARQGISHTKFEFPNYSSPIGKIMGAMLDGASFSMSAISTAHPLRNGNWRGMLRKGGPNVTYQLLAVANMIERQPELRIALERGHVLCDRYEIDSLAYGAIDCDGNVDWIYDLFSNMRTSDAIIVLDSSGYDRPGELDDNEKRVEFQKKVREQYKWLAKQNNWHYIDGDDFQELGQASAILAIHRHIVDACIKEGIDVEWDDEFIKKQIAKLQERWNK